MMINNSKSIVYTLTDEAYVSNSLLLPIVKAFISKANIHVE